MRHDEMRVMRLPVEGHDGQHHAGQPADDEGRRRSRRSTASADAAAVGLSTACRSRRRSAPPSAPPPASSRRKEGQRQMRDAGGEHVVHPQPEAQDRQRRSPPPPPSRSPAASVRAMTGRIVEMTPGCGQEDDVDLGVAEQPEQVLPQQASPPLSAWKKGRPKARSSSSSSEPRISGGKPVRIITATTSMYQAKIGMRVQRHARRAVAQHGDDRDLDRGGDGRDLDEGDAQQPEVGVDPGREGGRRQRRIHEPAAVRRDPRSTSAKIMIAPPNR